jgi:hypothetical protein
MLTKVIDANLFAERGYGKLLDEAVSWVVAHIPPVPWVPGQPSLAPSGVLQQKPQTLYELIESGWNYDERRVRCRLRRRWSETFPDDVPLGNDTIGYP